MMMVGFVRQVLLLVEDDTAFRKEIEQEYEFEDAEQLLAKLHEWFNAVNITHDRASAIARDMLGLTIAADTSSDDIIERMCDIAVDEEHDKQEIALQLLIAEYQRQRAVATIAYLEARPSGDASEKEQQFYLKRRKDLETIVRELDQHLLELCEGIGAAAGCA